MKDIRREKYNSQPVPSWSGDNHKNIIEFPLKRLIVTIVTITRFVIYYNV